MCLCGLITADAPAADAGLGQKAKSGFGKFMGGLNKLVDRTKEEMNKLSMPDNGVPSAQHGAPSAGSGSARAPPPPPSKPVAAALPVPPAAVPPPASAAVVPEAAAVPAGGTEHRASPSAQAEAELRKAEERHMSGGGSNPFADDDE